LRRSPSIRVEAWAGLSHIYMEARLMWLLDGKLKAWSVHYQSEGEEGGSGGAESFWAPRDSGPNVTLIPSDRWMGLVRHRHYHEWGPGA